MRWRRILDAGPIGRRVGIDVIRGANPARAPWKSAGSTCARISASPRARAGIWVSNSLCAPSIIVGIYDYYAHADFARARRRVVVVVVVVVVGRDATRRDNTIIVIPAVNIPREDERGVGETAGVRGRLSTHSPENEFIIIVIIVIVIASFLFFFQTEQ